jgi:hypothetical protein
VGPGLIVMCGDNDAGAFSTYVQAEQDCGTRLLLVHRDQAGGGIPGEPRVLAAVLAAAGILATAYTGSFRRFERIAVAFCAVSLYLLLCNDRAVVGPWTNRRGTNTFTSAVVAVLVTLSVVLTASVLFPDITGRQILDIIAGCAGVGGRGRLGAGPDAPGPQPGRGRPQGAGDLADAAAQHAVRADDVDRPQGGDRRPAQLPGHLDGHGHRQDRRDGDLAFGCD